MSSYLKQHGTRVTKQSEPMRSDQVENSAGGYVWAVDKWTRLRRFLILGSEGGSYYASERKLTKQNVDVVRECIAEDGPRTVAEIVDVSKGGKAPKNDPALFALACAISVEDRATKRAAAEALPAVARIGTHLYHFIDYAETMRGWGTVLRWAVQNWYEKNPEQLALQAIKYRQRDGWSHRDVLRLGRTHPDASPEIKDIYGFISGNTNHKWVDFDKYGRGCAVEPWKPTEITQPLITGYLEAKAAQSPAKTAQLVRDYNLPREALQTEHLNSKEVWEAMLDNTMPMTALIRNLATMTRIGILDSSEWRSKVVEQLGNAEAIHKARVHPMALLIGLRTYASGRGLRGQNTWNPIADITDALDEGFYIAFDNVEPTGKRLLLGLDVSGSMGGYGYGNRYGGGYGYAGVAGAPITPREAATAMALVTLHAEPNVEIMAFADRFMPVNFSRRQRLDDACAMTQGMPFMGTDCSIPMTWAESHAKEFDGFIVYTDSETWFGNIHPKQALDSYRQRTGINSKSVVVGMVSNGFSIADPTDAGMMDVVGFDTSAPALISEFVAGRI